jgi:pimeloyl-ACP methyl ester carboxylesterase
VVDHQAFDPASPQPTPVIFVHGLLGDPTNFLRLRRHLAAHGMRNFAAFAYAPRLDYQRLACRLGELVDALCLATGARAVDVVGHSLGGLVGRYLVEIAPDVPIRRLVTLGAPYFANPLPAHELALFGAFDPFIAPPHPSYGPLSRQRAQQVVVVPECGHLGLLYHPMVLHETAAFLRSDLLEIAAAPLALEAS